MYNKIINAIFFLGILFIALYFSLFQEINKDYFWLGPRYLVCEDNVLNLSINRDFSSLELRFVNNINIEKTFYTNYSIHRVKDNILLIRLGSKILNDTLRSHDIKFFMTTIREGTIPPVRKIKKVILNSKDISLYDFYDNYLRVLTS